MNRFNMTPASSLLVACLLATFGCARPIGGSPNSALNRQFKGANVPLSPLVSSHVLDPFEERGKIQIADRNLDEATDLAVTLRSPCEKPGWIVRAVLAAQTSRPNPTPSVYSYVWTVPAGADLGAIEREAIADSCVVGITNSATYGINSIPNDPDLAEEGHLTAIEAASSYDTVFAVPFVRIKPVVLAIIDTGFDLDHPDLKNIWWTNPKEIPNNGIDDEKNGYVDDVNGYDIADNSPNPQYRGWPGSQHGTHVTGLAAAEGNNGIGITGVMGRGVKVMAINAFGAFPGSLVTDLANSVRYAADNGADVINVSVGGEGGNATYEAALGYAISKGVTIVVAAGNDGKEIGPNFMQSPSMYAREFPGLISVASTDSESGDFSYFSNYGPDFVKMGAPGSENARANKGLLSTWPQNQYHRSQGTSMASPVVAGAASLAVSMLRARGYNPSPATIERILERSAVNKDNLKDKIQDGRELNIRQLIDFITRNYQPQS